jgi:hypothetical protein
MTGELVQQLRKSRENGSVLKVQLSNLRTRRADAVILVFEGVDDVGPYEHWIGLIGKPTDYASLAGSGKAQLLDLRKRLSNDTTGLKLGVLFFIDRDYDGLRGDSAGEDIFCTKFHSVENHIVCKESLKRILRAHLQCFENTDDSSKVCAAFEKACNEFEAAMRQASERLFHYSRFSLGAGRVEDRVTRYVQIGLGGAVRRYTDEELRKFVPLRREPSDEECAQCVTEGSMISGIENCRGKFVWAFFLRWLEMLVSDRRQAAPRLFSATCAVGFNATALNLTHAAAFAPVPAGLADFLDAASRSVGARLREDRLALGLDVGTATAAE